VLVVGEVEEANVWTDRDGNPRASLEVTAQLVKFMDRGDDEGEGEGEGEGEAISAPDLEQMPDIPF
jgi:single-stranded DNA-binding protein